MEGRKKILAAQNSLGLHGNLEYLSRIENGIRLVKPASGDEFGHVMEAPPAHAIDNKVK